VGNLGPAGETNALGDMMMAGTHRQELSSSCRGEGPQLVQVFPVFNGTQKLIKSYPEPVQSSLPINTLFICDQL
jgi:hypothetical protein